MSRKGFDFLINIFLYIALACIILGLSSLGMASEPELPSGLGADTREKTIAPLLPEGLSSSTASGEPMLPSGIDTEQSELQETAVSTSPLLPISGFWEVRAGRRLQEDPHEKETSLGEMRLQLETEKNWDRAVLRLNADFLADLVLEEYDTDLERGEGIVDLREASLLLRPSEIMDIKIGRQILTWGTGDMLFINDLFPKDWQSFFIGRDTEYLKAPSDALKTSFFLPAFNFDLVYTPRFDSDRGITGERISYYNSATGMIAGRNLIADLARPDDCFDDDEWALRVYRTIGGLEIAAYGYRGFWKSPAGMDMASGEATYPDLDVIGGSLRGQLGKGIANAEFGYYNSRNDDDGSNPLVRNSEWRFLFGYEMEVGKDFTAGMQYYVELMDDYDNYQRYAPRGTPESDKLRQVITLRLTKLLMDQNLILSLFTYYSPSDRDSYLRPNIQYKITDAWMIETGGNIFMGEDKHTFFGQFEDNTNAYCALRFNF